MRKGKRRLAALASTALIALVTIAPAMAAIGDHYPPGNPAFERTWARTDKPVVDGQVMRTWLWGVDAFTEEMNEPYDTMTGVRTVQYFDKARMEINNPNADPNALWYVTNGLLVNELMTGQMQVGDAQFVDRQPAEVNIAGDPGFEETPTYATYGMLMDDAPYAEGALINWTLARNGDTAQNTDLNQYNVTAGPLVPETGHRVASVFWEFLNSSGTVWENGQFVNARLFENAFYASGFPKTEAYWAHISVDGTEKWVLTQAFERRVLTYTPDNNAGWQVEAGNVGQHYYTWRYTEPGYPTGAFYAALNSLDGSGVWGGAWIDIADNGDMSVQIDAFGLTPNQEHMQHIHATGVDASSLQQADLCEVYGDIVFPLTPYPTADDAGSIAWEENYVEVDWNALGSSIEDKVIVLHGIEDGEGVYDAGQAVACGQIVRPPVGMSEYHVDLSEIEGSGASGTAHITLDGPRMHVEINVDGVTPNQVHMQHFHLTVGDVSCETYEDIVFWLTPYPSAGDDGSYNWEHEYIVNLSHLGDLTTRVLVVHGILEEEAYNAGAPVACGVVESGPPAPPPDFPTGDFYVELNPLGDSGVVGAAHLQLSEDGATLEVDVQANGLTADQEHMQHIHLVTDPEAEDPCSAYGDVIFPFEPYPTANSLGQVVFNHTYEDVDINVLGDLLTRVVVVHGIEVDGEYEAGPAVACGVIERPPLGMSSYQINLNPLAESGAVGAAHIMLDGPWMHVSLEAGGTTPDQVHMMHIHVVTDPEAEDLCSVYGAVLFPLTPYPTADAEGGVTQDQTYLVNLSYIGNLLERVVVVHGIEVEGEYQAGPAIACGAIHEDPDLSSDYGIDFQPIGDSGVTASGNMSLFGGELTVTIDAEGVTPEQQHLQHIHVVTDTEAEDLCSVYGDVLWDLDPFPTADAEGAYTFEQEYLVNTDMLGDLTTRVVVIHGILEGEEYDAGAPVACGVITELVVQ